MVLYSTNCPKCKVLEMKLKKKNIDYSVFSDVEAMMEMGIKAAPILELDDGQRLDFNTAIKWVNAQ